MSWLCHIDIQISTVLHLRLSEEKIFRQKIGNFVGESYLLKFAWRMAHENVVFLIIAIKQKNKIVWFL